jgi:hypothetical protein
MRSPLVRIFSLMMLVGLASGFSAGGAATAHEGAFSQQQNWITVPAGTRILIRTTDTVSSSGSSAESRFGGVLETHVMGQGSIVVPRGSIVHGRVVNAQSAGSMRGSSSLVLELTDVLINGTAFPIMTDTYAIAGQGSGGRTVGNVARGAGLGSAIGAVAGRGRGAAIGAVAGGALGTARSSGSQGQQVGVMQGSLIEFRLQQPVSLPAAR